MKENLKKLARYYKPYLGTFILDMILAMMSAAVAACDSAGSKIYNI